MSSLLPLQIDKKTGHADPSSHASSSHSHSAGENDVHLGRPEQVDATHQVSAVPATTTATTAAHHDRDEEEERAETVDNTDTVSQKGLLGRFAEGMGLSK